MNLDWTDLIKAIPLLVTAFFVIRYLREEDAKTKRYVHGKRVYTKKEQAILKKNQQNYQPIAASTYMPKLEKHGFELVDVASEATKIIYNQPLPKKNKLKNLKKNELVKLKFLDKEGDIERMWVVIKENHFPYFLGTLDNDSNEISTFQSGQLISFHSNHILIID